MSQALRYTPSLKPGLMIEDAEGKWAKYEVLAELVAQVDVLQALLTAADERADMSEGLLREARQHHGVMLMSDPPQDAWKYHRMNERIDAALRQAEGRNPSTCAWSEVEFSWHTGCGKEWQFTDGGLPSENGMEFCHSCGKKLVVEPAEGGGDDA